MILLLTSYGGVKNLIKKHVDVLNIEEKLKDDIEFICFFISQLPIPSLLRNDEQININKIQKEKLKEIVNFVLMNPSKFSHIEGIIKIIIEYNLLITDQLLITLFPYFYMHVNYTRKSNKSSKFHGSGVFLDYLGDNISEVQLLDQQIEEWIHQIIIMPISIWANNNRTYYNIQETLSL